MPELVPPDAAIVLEPHVAIRAAADQEAVTKDWWLSVPKAVNVRDGVLDLRGVNALSQLILDRPLRGALAFEVDMEYPSNETVNFSMALWTAESLPRELDSREGGMARLAAEQPGQEHTAMAWQGGWVWLDLDVEIV